MFTKIALALVPLAIVGAAASAASCAGTLENPEQFQDGGVAGPSSGTSSGGCTIAGFDMEAILKDDSEPAGCAKANCHNAGSSFFDFAADDLIERLQSAATLGSCSGEDLLVPGDPESSALFHRLAGGDCGQQMPFALPNDYWSAEQVACLADWITNLDGSGAGAGGSGAGAGGSGAAGGAGAGGEGTGGTGGN